MAPVCFRGLVMLMITRSEGSDLTRTLKLEGKLLEPWIGELESACGESLAHQTGFALICAT